MGLCTDAEVVYLCSNPLDVVAYRYYQTLFLNSVQFLMHYLVCRINNSTHFETTSELYIRDSMPIFILYSSIVPVYSR